MNNLVQVQGIEGKIFLIRGQKVMIDRDLAELYGVETRVLKQAVKRNIKRFPSDFMFELSKEEFDNWRSQFVTSNSDKIGLRFKPFAFTEQGIAMLSGVLHSDRAIHENIQIMRTFTKLRKMLSTHKELREKIELLESKYDKQFKVVFDAIRELIRIDKKPKKKMGFRK